MVFIIATNVGQLDNWLRREFAASGYSGTVVITLWLAGYRCVRPSATPAKTNWLTNACGTATAVNSLDERQNSASAEYPRRTGAVAVLASFQRKCITDRITETCVPLWRGYERVTRYPDNGHDFLL